MIKKVIEDAINDQINAELYSGYLYLSMSAYFEDMNLPGMANWMRVQEGEERFHAMKFYNYLVERGGRVMLKSIDGPETDWESPVEVFKASYEHEQKVTGMINDLMDLAIKERDHATTSMLNWFVDEQVEEEASASEIYEKLIMIGDNRSALFMLDKELGTRVLAEPSSEE